MSGAPALLLAAPGWPGEWRARLAHHLAPVLGPDAVVVPGEGFDPARARYAACWNHPPESLAGLLGLRAVFSLGAGVDHLLADPGLPDVPIARVVDPDLTGRMVEYVALHALMHLRRARLYLDRQARREWRDEREQPAARQVRAGVLGMGELGRASAGALAALGFDAAGWARRGRAESPVPLFVGEAGLGPFLARTDLLVCLLPLTPDTRGVLDLALFRRLPRDGRLGGAVLINAGRGGLQVEADVLAALEEGSLAAATLDVFEREPLPADSPLWSHPRVTVTPHNAANSDPEAVAALIARGVARLEAGGLPEHLVDRARGY